MLFDNPYLTPWHWVLLAVVILNMIAVVLILTARRSSNSNTAIIYGGILISATIWGISSFLVEFLYPISKEWTQFAINLGYSSTAISGLLAVIFAYSFQPDAYQTIKRKKLLLFIISILPITVSVLSHLSLTYTLDEILPSGSEQGSSGPTYLSTLTVIIVYWITAFVKLFHSVHRAHSYEKLKIALLTCGLLVAFLIGVFFNIIWFHLSGGTLQYMGPLGALFMLTLPTWGVLRYQLFDLEIRVARDALVTIFTVSLFVIGFILFAAILILSQQNLIIFLIASLFFPLAFLKVHDLVRFLINRSFFNDYLSNLHEDASRPTNLRYDVQIQKLQGDVQIFFSKFFSHVQVNIYFFDDDLKRFQSIDAASQISSLGVSDELVHFARMTRGVVLREEVDAQPFLKQVEKKIILRKLQKLRAQAIVSMRHWTNELVMVAFIGCDPITDDQRDSLRRHFIAFEPKWDEIAQKIYTNKRARESVYRIAH